VQQHAIDIEGIVMAASVSSPESKRRSWAVCIDPDYHSVLADRRQHMATSSSRQTWDPERLAYWYFRLNGFMTIENFIVHHESSSRQQTDADILASRFRYRRENYLQPMRDDPRIAVCDTFANVIIAEVKRTQCSLNGPWTNPDRQNMHRVLRAIGCVSYTHLDQAAASLYSKGRWSDKNATIRLFSIGDSKDEELLCGAEQQIEWDSVIEFCVSRFLEYQNQKKSVAQWTRDGVQLRDLALQGDHEGIRRLFGLNEVPVR
jgi:hypothetical protein